MEKVCVGRCTLAASNKSGVAPTRKVVQSYFCKTSQAPRIMQCRHRTPFQNSTVGFLNPAPGDCIIKEREYSSTFHSSMSKLMSVHEIQRYVLQDVHKLGYTRIGQGLPQQEGWFNIISAARHKHPVLCSAGTGAQLHNLTVGFQNLPLGAERE